jgi:hypothetical protein
MGKFVLGPVAGMMALLVAAASPVFASAIGDRPLQAEDLIPGVTLSADELLAQRVLDDDEKKPEPETAEDEQAEVARLKKKNPWIAMGLSAALPGAGQWYTRPGSLYSFLFLGVEATAWFLHESWDNDGEEKTREFQEFAWDGVVHPTNGAPQNDVTDLSGNWSWNRWRDSFGQPEGCLQPTNIDYPQTDSTLVSFWFTNRREFFEDIGKYDKYDCGWTSPGARGIYVDMRDETNSILERARQMTQVVLLNHIASAVHAYFITRAQNQRIDEVAADVRMGFHSDPQGNLGAQLVIQRRF